LNKGIPFLVSKLGLSAKWGNCEKNTKKLFEALGGAILKINFGGYKNLGLHYALDVGDTIIDTVIHEQDKAEDELKRGKKSKYEYRSSVYYEFLNEGRKTVVSWQIENSRPVNLVEKLRLLREVFDNG
jgi:hypothetical protein